MDLEHGEYLNGGRHYSVWQVIKVYWQSSQRFPLKTYLSIMAFMALLIISAFIAFKRHHAYFYTLPPEVVLIHRYQLVAGVVAMLAVFYGLLLYFRFLFTMAILMTVSLVGLDVVFNYWYNYFYDSLQAYNKDMTVYLLFIFITIAFTYIVIAVNRYYIAQLFGLRWRRWLTEQFISRWLQHRTYYLLENFDEHTDNPDQRIQEDVGALVSSTMDLTMGVMSASATFVAFIYILWSLSGIFTVSLGRFGTYHVPGYLVWVGVLYAIIGTLLTIKLGRPLVMLNFEQQRREATFRYAAIDLRTHAENVALYHGEEQQRTIMQRLFGGVLENWLNIILRQKKLLWFTASYNQLSVMLPLLVALPNYFDKVFLLGGLIQSLQAFNRVQDSLSFLINSYTQIAQWQAVGKRLTTFVNHMNEAETKALSQNKLSFDKHHDNAIVSKNISVSTPRGDVLLRDVNEAFKHGYHYLIEGVSGIGKSTFVRALAGIWPYSSGVAVLPDNKKIMFIPQRPYMPIGTLMDAILFPDKNNPALARQVEKILTQCHLEHLIAKLQETAVWTDQLSPGEQQRIAFARVLLHKPDWVFLDESTSMLDNANEELMYHLIKTEVPHCSIVSVGHRSTLEKLHDHIIDVSKYSAQHPAMA